MMERSTERVLFSGKVQGVGFRWTAERFARELPVTGYVRNLPDNDVEMLVCGVPESVNQLITSLQAHFGKGITKTERSAVPFAAQFTDFQIRR